MTKFSYSALAQRTQSLRDSIHSSLLSARSSARLTRAWVYQESAAVFDYTINGLAVAFDVTSTDDGCLRVEVLARKNSAKSLMAKLALEGSPNGKFLIADITASTGSEDPGLQISRLISATVDKIAEIGAADNGRLLAVIGDISPLVIVDVGANNLSEPPYHQLLDMGLCKLIGFEPQQEAFAKLQKNKLENETYFSFAIGAPGGNDLNIYSYSGFTSFYKIDESTIGIFPGWHSGTRLQETVHLDCLSLDDVPGLSTFDMLKIDIQGGELDVFRNARRSLASALCIITEVSFFPLYEKAPSFAEVHQELISQGFLLHKFLHQVHVSIGNSYSSSASNSAGSSQIIDGDAVYLRDYRNMETLSSSNIRKLALLSHFVFSSKDLALRMLAELVRRKEASDGVLDDYIRHCS